MTYLVGIRDKQKVVLDDVAAVEEWLTDAGCDPKTAPEVHYFEPAENDHALVELIAVSRGIQLTGVLGHTVATVWHVDVTLQALPREKPKKTADRVAMARGRLEFLAALRSWLGSQDSSLALVAEAHLENVYERQVERRQIVEATDRMRGRIGSGPRANNSRDEGANNRADVYREWQKLASSKRRNSFKVAAIMKELGLGKTTVYDHLRALELI